MRNDESECEFVSLSVHKNGMYLIFAYACITIQLKALGVLPVNGFSAF